jgi:hypothetical protein
VLSRDGHPEDDDSHPSYDANWVAVTPLCHLHQDDGANADNSK